MSMSLFDQVVNESYSADLGGYSYDSLDAAEESYINDVITDDPVTLFQYTGECSNAIMALEAAEARMEGMMCVKFMNARSASDEVAMEETVATMEGFVGNMWETLKEIVKKAYAAIKAFLIKVWNKFKSYGNVVRAMLTKYGDVLRHKRVPGLNVKWEEIKLTEAEPIMEKHLTTCSNIIEYLKKEYSRVEGAHKNDSSYYEDKDPRAVLATHKTVNNGTTVNHWKGGKLVGQSVTNKLPTPGDIEDELEAAIYPEKASTDQELEKPFEKIRPEAIKAADSSSYKTYMDRFMAIGNKRYQADMKCIQDLKREFHKEKSAYSGVGASHIHTEIRRCLNAEITIINICTHAMTTAAKRMQSQAISACRKAIMHHGTEGDGATYAGESYAPSGTTYFDSLMGNLGY